MAESAETKKVIDPRVEIDTSPPFESVKEAVDHFGGSGPWIPHHLLRLAANHNNEAFDVEKIEEQAVQLERDLIMKEKQTLNVLKELESAKRFVEGLKLNLAPEFSFMDSPDLNPEHVGNEHPTWPSPGLMFSELNQAKLNLTKTSVDLAAIEASVESLNKNLRNDHILVHRASKMQMQMQMQMQGKQVANFEAEQCKKMTEASRYEVMRAMGEIERTKDCIRMAEMRLNAAKKMEEAAKAVEAIALAQTKSHHEQSHEDHDGITLSFEEYKALSQKAKRADQQQLCSNKFIDTNEAAATPHQLEEPVLEKFEDGTNPSSDYSHDTNVVIEDSYSRTHTHVQQQQQQRSGGSFGKFKFRNSQSANRNGGVLNGSETGFSSIGEVLSSSRKVIVQDDVSERQHVSLSQMLKEQSRLILHPTKTGGEGNVQKQYFMQRKKFGFIQVPIPTKHTKKKTAAS